MDNQTLFEQATAQLRDFRLEPYAKEPPEHTFSKAFHSSLSRQYKLYAAGVRAGQLKAQRQYYAVLCVGLVLGLLVCSMSVGLLLPVFFGDQTAVPTVATVYGMSAPADGYTLSYLRVTPTASESVWQNPQRTRVGFRQTSAAEEVTSISGTQVPVWGTTGVLYGDETGAALRWQVGESLYVLWSEADGDDPQTLVRSVSPWVRKDYESDGTPLSQLEQAYAPANAKADGCLTITPYSIENEQMLTDFLKVVEKEEKGFLRVCDFRDELTVMDFYAAEGSVRMVTDSSRTDGSYEEGLYQRMSLLEIGGSKTLLLYALGETEPKQALQYEG